MIILVDQDDVLADFHGSFCQEWKRKFGQLMKPTFYKIEGKQKNVPPELEQRLRQIYYQRNFFLNLLPIEGAIEAVNEIKGLGHEVIIRTRPMLKSDLCLEEKKLWIKRWLGEDFVQQTFFVTDKTAIRGHFLIDDNPFPEEGLFNPTWEHIVFDRVYNQKVPRFKRRVTWQNWKEKLPELVR